MKKLYISIIIILLVLTAGYVYVRKNIKVSTDPKSIISFEGCVNAGYIVMESYPRQCRTPDGRTFAEEIPEKIVYDRASEDLIKIENPFPGAVTGKEFSVIGQARGYWYFEASFPVQVLDKDGNVLFEGPAQAEGEWMTESFVPFKIDVKIPQSYIGPATLVLKNDNASGLPENDKSVSFKFTIEY